jgi:hypothetical protein
VRRRPARHKFFASRTARRVVRSVPVNPIATGRRDPLHVAEMEIT